jgi:hypothetical protein
MSRTSILLTPEIEQSILNFIRAGAFPHVAAEAAGIPREVFDTWINLAEKPNRNHGRYRRFVVKIKQAVAQARLLAEAQILKERPLDWLKSGPGRENAENEGWTAPTKPVAKPSQINILMGGEGQALLATILQILGPFPEARVAVARALMGIEEREAKVIEEK